MAKTLKDLDDEIDLYTSTVNDITTELQTEIAGLQQQVTDDAAASDMTEPIQRIQAQVDRLKGLTAPSTTGAPVTTQTQATPTPVIADPGAMPPASAPSAAAQDTSATT